MNPKCNICNGIGFRMVQKWGKCPYSGRLKLLKAMERCACNPESQPPTECPAAVAAAGPGTPAGIPEGHEAGNTGDSPERRK